MRLSRRPDIPRRVELVGGQELVQGVARRLAVRGGVNGCRVGAVGCNFEFVFCVLVAVFLFRQCWFNWVDEVKRESTGLLIHRRVNRRRVFR